MRSDGSELFVHRQRVVMAPGEAPLLLAGVHLSFDVCQGPYGRLEAQNVRTLWGRPISNRVSGKRYSLIRKYFHNSDNLGCDDSLTQKRSVEQRGRATSHNSPCPGGRHFDVALRFGNI